jgi:hypothetical protein
MGGALCSRPTRRILGAAVQSARAAGDPVLRRAACGGQHTSTSSPLRSCLPDLFPLPPDLDLGPAGSCRGCATRCPYSRPEFLLGPVRRADTTVCQLHRAGGLAAVRGSPPTHERLSSRHVAGDPANVRAPDRDVEGSPATPTLPPAVLHAPRTAGGSATIRGPSTRTHRAQLPRIHPDTDTPGYNFPGYNFRVWIHPLPTRVECRAGGTVVA